MIYHIAMAAVPNRKPNSPCYLCRGSAPGSGASGGPALPLNPPIIGLHTPPLSAEGMADAPSPLDSIPRVPRQKASSWHSLSCQFLMPGPGALSPS